MRMLQLSELFHFTLAERVKHQRVDQINIAVSQAKNGIYFTIRIGSLPLVTLSSRRRKDLYFRGNVLKNTAI